MTEAAHPIARVGGYAVVCCAALAVVGAAVVPAGAHEPNTSYTRLWIGDDHLEIDLVFDLEALQRMAPLDADLDGRVSRTEVEAGAETIQRLLRSMAGLSLDQGAPELGDALSVKWIEERDEIPSEDQGQALVEYRFRRDVERRPEEITFLYDLWYVLGSRHVHFAKVRQDFVDEYEIVFRQGEPDFDFHTSDPPSLLQQIARFVRLGVEHISIGWDHIAFLVGLVVVARIRDLLWTISAFTVAHAVTLTAAALGWAALPAWLVESGIAVTIVYVAVENLYYGEEVPRSRLGLVFGFGLVHGFGFAGVLQELGLPREGLVRALVSFNLGIEIGQLAIVGVLVPVSFALRRVLGGMIAVRLVSVVLALLGAGWWAERSLGLELMPF